MSVSDRNRCELISEDGAALLLFLQVLVEFSISISIAVETDHNFVDAVFVLLFLNLWQVLTQLPFLAWCSVGLTIHHAARLLGLLFFQVRIKHEEDGAFFSLLLLDVVDLLIEGVALRSLVRVVLLHLVELFLLLLFLFLGLFEVLFSSLQFQLQARTHS